VADRHDLRAEPGAAAARPAVVTLRAVRKAYNAGTPVEAEVLHGIDLDLLKGEFCAVMGPSGSGKSTLLNIIGLLDRPSSGTVTVCGEQTGELDDRSLTRLRGHSIGFVFQYHHLITAFSALENVMMPMLGAAGFADEAMRERAAMLIDSVGLRDRQHNGAANLSGGQQQQLAIARALLGKPKLLLLDEPTEGIQPSVVLDIERAVKRIVATTGISVLLVEQHLHFVRQADWYYAMQKGGMVASGPTAELSKDVVDRFLSV
jgi:lipoprotein-releasing system ATP-binding protein